METTESPAITPVAADVSSVVIALTDVVNHAVNDAVVDVRKGQAQVIERIDALSNQVLALKNSLIAMNQVLEKLIASQGKKSSVVFLGKETVPKDLFGNE